MWHRPVRDDASVQIAASWEGWRPREIPRTRDDGFRVTTIVPPPGEQRYAIVEDGTWLPDAYVGTTSFYAGHEVTLLDVGRCDVPMIRVDGVTVEGEIARVNATFVGANGGEAIDPSSFSSSIAPLDVSIDAARGTVAMRLKLPKGKHVAALSAKDVRGVEAEPARATIWMEERPFEWRDATIYQVLVDRYRDSEGTALVAPSRPSARAGGTIEGVRKSIAAGELDALGVNALWLSPLYRNPSGDFPGTDGRPYQGYHGYWPLDSHAIEPTQGSDRDLHALVSEAHARGIRVIFDVVPHHVHREHEYVRTHPEWFTSLDASCVCGAPGCSFESHLETCWFTSYLPTFDLTNAEAARRVTDDVLFWLDRFDGDGVRIDAVPMMPRAQARRIAASAHARFDHPGNRTFVLGETFTGAGGHDALRYYLGPDGLDSEFDFPLMWSLRATIGDESSTMIDLARAIAKSRDAFADTGAVMSLIVGNHDVPRFASVSALDPNVGDGWSLAPQSNDPSVYAKQAMALGTILTLPGAPVIYYGDEVALAGRGDPDVRRPMPSETSLSSLQRSTRETVRTIGRLRSCSTALRRGDYRFLFADAEHLVFARELGEERAIVVLSRNASEPLSISLPGIPDGSFVDALAKTTLDVSSSRATLDRAPRSIRIFVPTGSSCP